MSAHRLTYEEMALTLDSAWDPSFDGWAIVDADFTFRSVNQKFCELLGVTPAELIGQRFQDVTPIEMRQLEEDNAKLVMEGRISFYLLPKMYRFSGHSQTDVVLLVTRVPRDSSKPFRFFLSRIMLDEEKTLRKLQENQLNSEPTSLKLTNMVEDFWMKWGKWLIGIGTVVGTILFTLMEYFK